MPEPEFEAAIARGSEPSQPTQPTAEIVDPESISPLSTETAEA
jgi:hypothetical protein